MREPTIATAFLSFAVSEPLTYSTSGGRRFAGAMRIILVGLNQNVAAEFLDALQFAGEVNGFLPAGNRRGGFVADVADSAQFTWGCLKNFGRVAKMFQQQPARTGRRAR